MDTTCTADASASIAGLATAHSRLVVASVGAIGLRPVTLLAAGATTVTAGEGKLTERYGGVFRDSCSREH